jgi:hypothetical protein
MLTESLPSNDKGDTHTDYAVEMGSGGLIYVPSFIKIGSDIQKLMRFTEKNRHTYTHRQQGDLIILLSFLQNKENTLIPLSVV